MFGFLKKDPRAKLQKQYDAKLEAALAAQRNGDMRLFASLTEEAEALRKQLDAIDQN